MILSQISKSPTVLLVLPLMAACTDTSGYTANKPNVIVIFTDDHGYADVGFHDFPASREVITPNIDKLASQGIIFSNGYVASSTCGPSRASLLTGRSSSRFAMEDNLNLPGGETGPPMDEILIPVVIGNHGYVSGAFGKWHLGEIEGLTPIDRGFDYYWGGSGGSGDYLFRRGNPHPPCWDPPRSDQEAYMTDAITDEAVAFIERHHQQAFFAYIAHNAPHSPFETNKTLLERVVKERPQFAGAYQRMLKESNKWDGNNYAFGRFKGLDLDMEILRLIYISMLLSVDDGVGKVMETLERYELTDNTLIYFLSDNGAALARPNDLGGVNLPLRSGKGSVYDGGVRVPFVMTWPAVLKPGHNDTLIVSAMDIFSTTIELAGGTLPNDRIIDGVNIIPYLTGEKTGQAHDYLFFRRKDRNIWSIRQGDYKWVKGRPSEEAEGGGVYHIQKDIAESNDLSETEAGTRNELRLLFERVTEGFPDPARGSEDE